MKGSSILIIGGGIAGLTASVALRAQGFAVDIIERDPSWSVYGVGIIQQSNVIRAMDQLGLLEDYLGASFPFENVEIFAPSGQRVAIIPSPRLVPDRPANVGIGRRALHKVLGDRAIAAGATIRLGVTATALEDDGEGVDVVFSDGTKRRYDLVIGADGVYSETRALIFPDAPQPAFTGQGVWRHNFARPDTVIALQSFAGPVGIGLVPLSDALMYMFVTTREPGNPRYAREGLAAAMRDKLVGAPSGIAALAEQIVDDDEVVYKPLEYLFLDGDWHRGRVVLIGDAVHSATPHLGQGAGMAIEDSIVLADELAKGDSIESALTAFRNRRIERCRYIVDASLAICRSQLGEGAPVDVAHATHDMFEVTAQPI